MQSLIAALEAELGDGILTGEEAASRYGQDWSTEPACAPAAVVRPSSTEEVSRVLALCSRHGQPVVVQGGLTGLSGGAIPRPGALALSLERLNGVEEIDTSSMTMTVKAGTPLETIQKAAEDAEIGRAACRER